ncbi:MAG TPA: ABC transporter permease [Candidatus Acidoferrales bacterium]|nr:ABC transporter permease [Candidatus Acidoferrales bacterium]
MRLPWRRRQEDLREELESHLDLAARDRMERGDAPQEACTAARREFGNAAVVREVTHDQWGWAWLENLLQDIRFGLRMLRKSPGFTAVAVLTLALGIGANTAIFSVIDAVLIRPLPFQDPDRVVQILETAAGLPYVSASGEDYFDWESQNHTLEASSITTWTQDYNASGAGQPERVTAIRAEANFFSVIGAQPLIGRGFAPGEDQEGKDHVAVVSYGFWQRHFAGNADALGKSLELNSQPYIIVGVMPRWFNYPQATDVWIPIDKTVKGTSARGNYSFRVIGRLKPRVSVEQAQADLSAISSRLTQLYPDTNKDRSARVVPLKTRITQDSRPQLLILLGAVGLVLLVACANVANLLLARAARREREMVLRGALGASRSRIVRQLLTESVLLSLGGALLGLLGASWCVNLADSIASLPVPRANPIQLNFSVLSFTIAVTLFVGILFGFAPALAFSRVNLAQALRESSRSVSSASGWRRHMRDALVVTEIAISLALLIGAGLLLRTFARMRTAEIGVIPENVLTMAVILPESKYPQLPQRRAFYDQLISRIQSSPGITAAAVVQTLPLEGDHTWGGYPEGAPDWRSSLVQLNVDFVTPDYFRVLGIPFRAGRNFTPQDFDRALTVSAQFSDYLKKNPNFVFGERREFLCSAILSRAAAQALWPNQDPIGRIFVSGNIPVQVVGVVGDVKEGSIRDAALPQAYFPLTQELDNPFYPERIVVKREMPNQSALALIRSSLDQLDSTLPLFSVRTMQQVIAEDMQDTSLQTVLLGVFAAVALILAAIGIYGVMSYVVEQRTHEIGIRVALGARRLDVLRLILGRGARLTFAGIAIGLFLAFALTRLMAKLLYGVTATDPLTFTSVALLLIVVALAACYIPARRAMRVDPMVALRYE